MGLGKGLVFGHSLAGSTKRREKEDECGNFKGWPNHPGIRHGQRPPVLLQTPQNFKLTRFMNSIHLSTLQLTANTLHAAQADQMRAKQGVIRTIKFRIAAPKPDANGDVHLPEKEKAVLDELFDAFEQWREMKILKELNAEFNSDPAKFLAATATRNQGFYNTKFVKGKKEDGLPRALRTCYAFSLPQEMKSFRTRFENEMEKIRKTYEKNLEDWQETMLPLFTENGEAQPPPPTFVDAFEPWRQAREPLKRRIKEVRNKKSCLEAQAKSKSITKDIRAQIKKEIEEFKLEGEKLAEQLTKISSDQHDRCVAVTKAQLEAHNNWVFIAKQLSWERLCIQHRVPRKKLASPNRLKGLPGFPGSARYAERITPLKGVEDFEELAKRHVQQVTRFKEFTTDQWEMLLNDYDAPGAPEISEADDVHENVRRKIGKGLRALTKLDPNRPKASIAAEICQRLFRDTAELKKHLWANLSVSGHPQDGSAARKMIESLNLLVEFALQPIRRLDGIEAYAAFVPEKREKYGNVNGAMQEPSNETVAIPFTGLSVNAKGLCQYKAALCYRTNQNNKAEWSFQFCANEKQNFRLTEPGAPLKGKRQWNSKDGWTAIASKGGGRGGRKKAKPGAPKQIVRLQMRHADDGTDQNPFRPLVLPLAFGKRQGRKFLWNYDFSLLAKSDYECELGEGKLLRDKPANGSETKFYLTLSLRRTIPAAALKDKLERFAEKNQREQFDILGADRGETVPLSYVVVAPDGSDRIRPHRFAEFQLKFNLWRKAIATWEEQANKEGADKADDLPCFQINWHEREQWKKSAAGKEKLSAWSEWLWESQPDDGFGVIEPEHRWRMMRIGLEKKEHQRQFATWSSELRKREKEIARALTGKVVRTILDVGSKRRMKFVLESLASGVVTRGGKDSRMSQRPYERILKTLEYRLNEAGMYRQPKDERGVGSYHLRFIPPHYTSQTCSRCGLVHDSKYYRELALSLVQAKGRWVVTINGLERELKTEYKAGRYGEKTIDTNEELSELLNGRSAGQVLKRNKDGKPTRDALRLISIVEKCVPYREKQHIFRCLAGCEPIHADVQAALNIARKLLFMQRDKSGKSNAIKTELEENEEKSSLRDDWQDWYRRQLPLWKK
jgi:hypothetical protein